MRILPVVILSLLSAVVISAQTPLRPVKGNTLTSKELPAVVLKFGKDFKYAGGQQFVLYDLANAEQHFFIDAGKDGRIRRMYWVQFEGYLPSNSRTYNYRGSKTIDLGGLDFIADTYSRNIRINPGRPDSDGALARNFLAQKGFRLGSDEAITQRFLHFIGPDKRNELMIIYLEDMSGLGLTSADLEDGGKAADKRTEVYEAMLARAQKDLQILH